MFRTKPAAVNQDTGTLYNDPNLFLKLTQGHFPVHTSLVECNYVIQSTFKLLYNVKYRVQFTKYNVQSRKVLSSTVYRV